MWEECSVHTLKQVVHIVTSDFSGLIMYVQIFLFSVCLCPQMSAFDIILSVFQAVGALEPNVYLSTTVFWLLVLFCGKNRADVCVCMHMRACAYLHLHACVYSHPPLSPQIIGSTRHIPIKLLCDHWPYASECPLLFSLHFPIWIIQHGGHENFWIGHDNRHHICSVLDVMCGGRILKHLCHTLSWCLGKWW